METKRNQGKTNNNGTNNTGKQAEVVKVPLKDRLQKRWDTFRTTKGGRWAIRGAKAAAILTALGVTAKKSYDAGVKSVKLPEPDHIEEPVEETAPEAPAEEPAVEEEI